MNERTQFLVSDREPVLSLFFILLVVLIGFLFIGPLLGFGISALFYDGNLLADIQNPTPSIWLPMMVTQAVTSLVGLIIIPALYVKFSERKPLAPFFPREKEITKVFAMIILLGISFMVAISPITEWNMNFEFPEFMSGFGDWARIQEDKLMEMTKVLTNFDSPSSFVIGLLVVAVLPGIGEELVFRGLIQNELWRSSKNIHVAIWVSAFLFSAIHIQFFGFVPRLLLGALFGYLYYWSGNLLIPMVAHFFHNGFTLTMIYLYSRGTTEINIDSEESAPVYLVALCAVATFVLLYYFRKNYAPEPDPS